MSRIVIYWKDTWLDNTGPHLMVQYMQVRSDLISYTLFNIYSTIVFFAALLVLLNFWEATLIMEKGAREL